MLVMKYVLPEERERERERVLYRQRQWNVFLGQICRTKGAHLMIVVFSLLFKMSDPSTQVLLF